MKRNLTQKLKDDFSYDVAGLSTYVQRGRIPRKIKKRYKKIWEKRLGYRVLIIRDSVAKSRHWGGTVMPIWGCAHRPRNQNNFVD